MEFGSGILGAEAPVDGGLGSVASGFVGGDGSSQSHFVAVASAGLLLAALFRFVRGKAPGNVLTGPGIALLASGWLSPSGLGIAFIVGQAVIVGLFAELQFIGLRRSTAAEATL